MVFSRILVANRSAVACRIIRACHALGIQAAVIFSEADKSAPHVAMADDAYFVGPPPAAQSYLNVDRILQIAHQSGAEAVHPGYGFMAENATFARRCHDEGLAFIGPSPEAIAAMGQKTAARRVMSAAGVQVVPGSNGAVPVDVDPLPIAEAVGFPVLVKASGGGGGIGMKVARSPERLAVAVRDARALAQRSFGDGTIYIERLVERPRHVEVQIFGDAFGNLVHLFERECSVQRRYQKVIEEAPSPAVDATLRNALTTAAVRAGQAVRYVNAGTVECLLGANRDFYFLEMNTRLQVEHGITEAITGLDIVQTQIKVAAGEALPWAQEEIRVKGHAIECRVYAEDPSSFAPSPGRIVGYREPSGAGVRVDSGMTEGGEMTVFYDPLIAKVITWGEDRPQAIARMVSALQGFVIEGVKTNIPLHLRVLQDPSFGDGVYDTGIVGRLGAQPKAIVPTVARGA
ncbi:MAG: acetyl-CoA carboxylase biotin carboxylase subunit [Chloroflexi bacterium]|nr:acetyl-CoA carboxylase biotin carboxylase subunit [Chloroflexota bacterium]